MFGSYWGTFDRPSYHLTNEKLKQKTNRNSISLFFKLIFDLLFSICINKHSDPSILDECGLEENTRDVLLNNIRRKLTSQAVKIRADIECACYGYEGIDAVKAALRAGLELSTEELPIKINLIAPPLYGEFHQFLFYRGLGKQNLCI